jgi:NAD(P)-dependent dehydrogenase (short-subunit alcohol dehydrogenase family)
MAFTLDQFRLDGKVAIVTGAGGRPNSIGEAYSLGLANAGASVVCADLVKEGAEACAERVKAAGGKAIGVQVDISEEDSAFAMAKAAKEAFGVQSRGQVDGIEPEAIRLLGPGLADGFVGRESP